MRTIKRILFILFIYHIETIHRFLFDYVYVHDENRWRTGDSPLSNDGERLCIYYYNYLTKTQPNWRYYLWLHKTLLNRAYFQNRLHPLLFWLRFKINKRNYFRYSKEPIKYLLNKNNSLSLQRR